MTNPASRDHPADPIYTIGHSNHDIDRFAALLKDNGVEAVADVRSQPYSRWHPQFNRETLQAELRARGIAYVFLGRELGARSDDPSCYDESGRVVYGRIAATELFKSGIERVQRGRRRWAIALMCAEKDPVDCHRTILVARELEERRGARVVHILSDGSRETHADAVSRLAEQLGLIQRDLFASNGASDDVRADAYAEQERRIAYGSEGRGEEGKEPDGQR